YLGHDVFSRRHDARRAPHSDAPRKSAGANNRNSKRLGSLTACTYSIVVLVLPPMFDDYVVYLVAAESVAHFGECLLFWGAFRPLTHFWRDMATVFGANLASFGFGMLAYYLIGL